MSKKHKNRQNLAAQEAKLVTNFANKELDHMYNEWFYVNDISWFKSVTGDLIAPVNGVVKHIGLNRIGSPMIFVKNAEKAIVDGGPLGKCYSKKLLEELISPYEEPINGGMDPTGGPSEDDWKEYEKELEDKFAKKVAEKVSGEGEKKAENELKSEENGSKNCMDEGSETPSEEA